MSLGCIVCTALIVSKPLVYPYTNGNFGHRRVVSIYLQRGASLVVRFICTGNLRTSGYETSKQQCRASRFLFVFTLP